MQLDDDDDCARVGNMMKKNTSKRKLQQNTNIDTHTVMFSSWKRLKEKSQCVFDCAGAYKPILIHTNAAQNGLNRGRCNGVKSPRLCGLTIEWMRSRIILESLLQSSWTIVKTEGKNTLRVFMKKKKKKREMHAIVSLFFLQIFWNLPITFHCNALKSSVQVAWAHSAQPAHHHGCKHSRSFTLLREIFT